MSGRMSDRMPDSIPKYMSKRRPDGLPEYMPHRMSDRIRVKHQIFRMSVYMTDKMSDSMLDRMPEYMSDRTPDVRLPDRQMDEWTDG